MKSNNFIILSQKSKKWYISLVILTVLFALLIIEAVNLVSPVKHDSGDKNALNQMTQSSDEQKSNDENNTKESTPKDKKNASSDGNSSENFSSGIDNDIKNSYPQLNIDLSRSKKGIVNDNGTGNSFGGNGNNGNGSSYNTLIPGSNGGNSNSYTITSGSKPEHTPIVEIAGIPGTSFLRLYTMSEYSYDTWSLGYNTYYTQYVSDMTSNKDDIEIRTFKPKKGYLPVLANQTMIKFPSPLIMNFPDADMYYADKDISESYKGPLKYKEHDSNILKKSSIVLNSSYKYQYSTEIRNLSGEITLNCKSNNEKITAIKNYLKRNYTLGKAENSYFTSDALSDFLFTSKKGTSLDFISAFVNLLRCTGISARMATGYKIDPDKNYQIVYEDQMCVYPEIQTDEYGWVPVDMTDEIMYSPTVGTNTEIIEVNSIAKKGSSVHVKGKITYSSGKPVNDVTVLVYFKKNKNDGCLANSKGVVTNGKFDVECLLDNDMDIGKYNVVAFASENDVYKGSWSDPEIKIITGTRIIADSPKGTLEGIPFVIKGKIMDTASFKTISGTEIKVSGDNGVKIGDTSTSSKIKGALCSLKLSAGADSIKFKNYFFISCCRTVLTLNYKGSEFYLPSQSTLKMEVWSIAWQRIVGALILILLFVIIYIVISKKRIHRKLKGAFAISDSVNVNKTSDVFLEEKAVNGRHLDDIIMEFPQISSGFPDVWSVKEPLDIRIKGNTGDFDNIEMNFDNTGIFCISVYAKTNRKFVCKREINIVLYQEEIVFLGQRIFNMLNKRLSEIHIEKMTPSEISDTIIQKYNLKANDLGSFIYLFEKATYGTGDICRNDYEEFYKSFIKLEIMIGDTSL